MVTEYMQGQSTNYAVAKCVITPSSSTVQVSSGSELWLMVQRVEEGAQVSVQHA